jgi:hypothetical protein
MIKHERQWTAEDDYTDDPSKLPADHIVTLTSSGSDLAG